MALIEQRFIGNDAGHLDAAGSRNDDFGFGIIDAHGQFLGRKSAEHHRMNCPEARAGQHGDDGLRNHRHVDQDPIAFDDPLGSQSSGKPGDFIAQLIVGISLNRIGDRAVVNKGILLAATVFDVEVQRHCSRC